MDQPPMREGLYRLLPGMCLALPLPLLAWWLLGAAPVYLWEQPLVFGQWVMIIVQTAVLCTFLVHVLGTLVRARELADPRTGQVDIRRAMRPREAGESLLLTALLMVWMLLAMSGAPAMADLYRAGTPAWHDAALWQLEEGIFTWLQAHPPDADQVRWLGTQYGLMWPFMLLVFAVVVVARRHEQALLMAMTVLLMFYARLLVAMAYPTQGPAFAYPEAFTFLRDTGPHAMQQVLASYQAGVAGQNGLHHGLVAMPSLHIGLTALSAWHLALLWRPSLWLTVPWLLVTWAVTVVLGWHYAVDGLGGLAVAMACHLLARALLALADRVRAPFLPRQPAVD